MAHPVKHREVRILCTSDTHSGSRYGLTHPDYMDKEVRGWLMPLWKWWEATVKEIGQVDAHICHGDAVDGQGDKDRGVSELYTDVEKQGEIAAAGLALVKAGETHLVYGTTYHVAGSHSYENHVARLLKADIADTMYLRAGGLKLRSRHVMSSSQTPYGQPGLVAKEGIRELLGALQDDVERPDVVLGGHVHTYSWIDNGMVYCGAVPCLQLPLGVFSRTQRPWWYRCGLLELRIADGYCQARPHLMSLRDVRRRMYAEIK